MLGLLEPGSRTFCRITEVMNDLRVYRQSGEALRKFASASD